MKKSLALPILAACACAEDPSPFLHWESVEEVEQKLIYGADDRQEYGQLGTQQRRLADATAVIASNAISCSAATCSLATTPWTTGIPYMGTAPTRLCSNVRFRGQPDVGNCSGFLVGPDLLVTAGHCMDSSNCTSTNFVFGYNADATGGGVASTVPRDNVYSCSTVIARGVSPEDWQLLRLDRVVRGRAPLYVRHSGAIANGTAVTAAGYPYGIPFKYSPTGQVTDGASARTFGHNLDTFAGNSGCAVFDAASGIVEGIHVTAPFGGHFISSSDSAGACLLERTCGMQGCPEFSAATRITLLSNRIPLTPALTLAVQAI